MTVMSSGVLNLLVHGSNTVSGEVLWIELEVLVVVVNAILVSPLDVHPEHVHWEVVCAEVVVSLTEDVG